MCPQDDSVIGHHVSQQPSLVNLLQFHGYAIAERMTDHEGSGTFDFHFELYNPAPAQTVTITHAEWYHASPGGWLTNGPWPMVLPQPDVAQPLLSETLVGPYLSIISERHDWVSFRLSHMLFLFRAESPGYYQHLLGQVPIGFTPTTDWTIFPSGLAPSLSRVNASLLPLSAPVFLTLMEDLTIFPVDHGNENWLPITGQIVNDAGGSIQITSLSWKFVYRRVAVRQDGWKQQCQARESNQNQCASPCR